MKKRINKKNENTEKTKNNGKKIYLLKLILFIILFIFCAIYYMRFIETNRLKIKEIKIESIKIPESLSGIKLLHVSDLHYKTTISKEYLKKMVKEINKLKPDVLVFTGDLLNSDIKYSEDDYKDLIYYFNKINANNKYYIKGDEDYKNDDISSILESASFISLNNKEDYIYGNDNSKIIIHGLGSFLKNDFDMNNSFITNDNNFFNIVLFHEPDNILELQDKNIDLALSGHSLNNRINLPIFKNLMSVDGAINYFDDYYNIAETHLYISAGVGTNEGRLRLFTPPSINFYRIVRK